LSKEPGVNDPWPFPSIQFVVDPARTALLVIDMQYHDAHPDYGVGLTMREQAPILADYYFDRLKRVVVPSIQRLLDAFRRERLRVVHITLGAELDDLGDLPPTARARSLQRYQATGRHTFYARSTREFEILPELAPRPNELVINKTTLGAFNSTVLDRTLRNLGIETVVVTGVVTSVCVETTARDAVDRGYNVILVDDGCAAWDEDSHLATMRSFRRYFGRVTTGEEILAQIAPALVGRG
jgi:biuret amidohydrolase